MMCPQNAVPPGTHWLVLLLVSACDRVEDKDPWPLMLIYNWFEPFIRHPMARLMLSPRFLSAPSGGGSHDHSWLRVPLLGELSISHLVSNLCIVPPSGLRPIFLISFKPTRRGLICNRHDSVSAGLERQLMHAMQT